MRLLWDSKWLTTNIYRSVANDAVHTANGLLKHQPWSVNTWHDTQKRTLQGRIGRTRREKLKTETAGWKDCHKPAIWPNKKKSLMQTAAFPQHQCLLQTNCLVSIMLCSFSGTSVQLVATHAPTLTWMSLSGYYNLIHYFAFILHFCFFYQWLYNT